MSRRANDLPPPAAFTRDDEAYCHAYMANRALLFQLWDLASVYPFVATKIHVRVRKADPRRDYAYDETRFGDSAIVVKLSWFDARTTCRFLSCNPTYPRGVPCRPGDEPRVYPSGDRTTMTACEPSCFMVRESRSTNGDALPDASRSFRSDVCHVMSARSGRFAPSGATTTVGATMTAGAELTAAAPATDFPPLAYNRESDECEVANAALLAFVTDPSQRSGDGNECRVSNFLIGDDLKLATVAYDDGGRRVATVATTGRHSRSYCAGFDKNLDESTLECEETLLDRILSYTFIGSALIRLARHAVYGDRCDRLLPAVPERAETDANAVQLTSRSRRAWFADSDETWCLPPPNILLSDLGVTRLGQVWSNRDGGRVESAQPDDFRDDDASAFDGGRAARRAMQSRGTVPASSRPRRSADRPFIGHVPRSASNDDSSDADDDARRRVLNFDAIYEEIVGAKGSDEIRDMIFGLAAEVGNVVAFEVVERWATKTVRFAFNRTLRFVGQRLTGHASRTLVAMGVRAATSRMVSTILSRFTTRLMLALATTASGVGTIVGLIELVGMLLDFMLLFGWDPGHYKAQFDNGIYDDMAVGWIHGRKRVDAARYDPYLVLGLFGRDRSGAVVSDGGGGRDASTDASARRDDRFHLVDVDAAPWYFAPFADAVASMVRDNATGSIDDARMEEMVRVRRIDLAPRNVAADDDDRHPLRRMRPMVADNPIFCTMLWSMHYYQHRGANSLGQRVDIANDATVRLDDDFVAGAVRDNELAAVLASAYSRPGPSRDALLGAARRNLASVATDALMRATVTVGGVVAALVAVVATTLSRRLRERRSLGVAVVLSVAVLLIALPLIATVTACELIVPDGDSRTYDRPNVRGDTATSDDDVKGGDKGETRIDDGDNGAANIDDVDRLCDWFTDLLRYDDDGGGDDSDAAEAPIDAFRAIRDAMIGAFRSELRVIYGV